MSIFCSLCTAYWSHVHIYLKPYTRHAELRVLWVPGIWQYLTVSVVPDLDTSHWYACLIRLQRSGRDRKSYPSLGLSLTGAGLWVDISGWKIPRKLMLGIFMNFHEFSLKIGHDLGNLDFRDTQIMYMYIYILFAFICRTPSWDSPHSIPIVSVYHLLSPLHQTKHLPE